MRYSILASISVQLFSNVEVSSWVAPVTLSNRPTQALFMATGKGKASQDKQDVMLDFIETPQETSVGDPPNIAPEDDEDAELVRCIVKAADGRKAEDVVALRISHVSTMTSFLVICSGNSRPQNQAIAAAISNDVQEQFDLRTQGSGVPEGNADSGWMLLDYGPVMVHVMTPKSRLFYDVEGQWREKGGEYMDLTDILIPNTVVEKADDADVQMGGGMADLSEEDDPFWS
mmetsp:Transcript_14635/g.20691  ORF Transcript_14635/g.20691 Transcript_14635/m.20691 type:complete len:230 (-) Transcript_14635:125-814(-)